MTQIHCAGLGPRLTLVLIFLTPALLLSVPHGGNAAFFLLFLASLWGLWINRPTPRQDSSPGAHLTIALLIAPIIAVAMGQLLRGDLIIKEFDAPSRLLAATAIFLWLSRVQLSPAAIANALGLGAAAGLILLTQFLSERWMSHYGGRFSTEMSAPNDFGGYVGILMTLATTLLITTKWERSRANFGGRLLLLAGFAAGLWLILGSQSRGPWLATGVSLVFLLFLSLWIDQRRGLALILGAFLSIGLTLQLPQFSGLKDRLTSTIQEPIAWLQDGQRDTSGGTRLSMIPASIELFQTQPLSGFGDFGYSPLARTEGFKQKFGNSTSDQLGGEGGPHNELAARSLQSGVWGLAATLLLLIAPVVLFAQRLLKDFRTNSSPSTSLMGLGFAINIFLLSFVLEPYSLKHTATFNALLLAVLLSTQVSTSSRLRQSSDSPAKKPA